MKSDAFPNSSLGTQSRRSASNSARNAEDAERPDSIPTLEREERAVGLTFTYHPIHRDPPHVRDHRYSQR